MVVAVNTSFVYAVVGITVGIVSVGGVLVMVTDAESLAVPPNPSVVVTEQRSVS